MMYFEVLFRCWIFISFCFIYVEDMFIFMLVFYYFDSLFIMVYYCDLFNEYMKKIIYVYIVFQILCFCYIMILKIVMKLQGYIIYYMDDQDFVYKYLMVVEYNIEGICFYYFFEKYLVQN